MICYASHERAAYAMTHTEHRSDSLFSHNEDKPKNTLPNGSCLEVINMTFKFMNL
jgi:hypothetical protein